MDFAPGLVKVLLRHLPMVSSILFCAQVVVFAFIFTLSSSISSSLKSDQPLLVLVAADVNQMMLHWSKEVVSLAYDLRGLTSHTFV